MRNRGWPHEISNFVFPEPYVSMVRAQKAAIISVTIYNGVWEMSHLPDNAYSLEATPSRKERGSGESLHWPMGSYNYS